MRTDTIAILGAPFAALAFYGCLALLGRTGTSSIVVATLWGAVWLAVAHFGRDSRLLRRRRSMRGRGMPGGRGVWTGAVLSSLFLPVPVYGLTLVIDQLRIVPTAIILPVLAVLALPAPTALWWMTLWAVAEREETMLRPIGWRRYTPLKPARAIPPRGRRRGDGE